MIKVSEPHKHLFYGLQPVEPPTIVVDDNYGYIAYTPITSGYKNISLRYSNIKESAGLNIYCSSESIGVCLFKNETMFSLIDMSINDFFSVSLDEVSVSLAYATRISVNKIAITAIVNTDPATNQVLVNTKAFNIDGSLLSLGSKFSPSKITDKETEVYTSLFNEDGSFKAHVDDVKYVAFETYNGATGFEDVNTTVLEIGVDTKDAMFSITNESIKHAAGLNQNLTVLVDKGCYSFKSMKNRKFLIFVAISKSKTYVIIEQLDGTLVRVESFDFKIESSQENFDSIYNRPIYFNPVRNSQKLSSMDVIYCPAGAIVAPSFFTSVAFSRLEMFEDKLYVSEYVLSFTVRDDEVSVGVKKEEGDDHIVATISYIAETESSSGARYVNGVGRQSINPSSYLETDISCRNEALIHKKRESSNSLPNQTFPISTTKSMCGFMLYL